MSQVDNGTSFLPPFGSLKESHALHILEEAANSNPDHNRLHPETLAKKLRARLELITAKRPPLPQSLADDAVKQESKAAAEASTATQSRISEAASSLIQLKQEFEELSSERTLHVQQIIDRNSDRLMRTALCNHANYISARRQRLENALIHLSHSEQLSTIECEKLIRAIQFDIESSRLLSMDKIMKHRKSIMPTLEAMTQRELLYLQELVKNKRQCQMENETDSLITKAQREVVDNWKEVEHLQTEIALERARVGNPTSAQLAYASADVNLRLIQIMDGLLSTAPNASTLDSALAHSVPGCEQQIQETTDMIAELKDASGDPVKTDQHDSLIREIEHITEEICRSDSNNSLHRRLEALTKRSQREHGPIKDPDDEHYRVIRETEAKIDGEDSRSFLCETQSLAQSSTHQLQRHYLKLSLESPLLSERNIDDHTNVSSLTRIWQAESARRLEDRRKGGEERAAVILRRLRTADLLLNQKATVIESCKKLQLDLAADTPSSAL